MIKNSPIRRERRVVQATTRLYCMVKCWYIFTVCIVDRTRIWQILRICWNVNLLEVTTTVVVVAAALPPFRCLFLNLLWISPDLQGMLAVLVLLGSYCCLDSWKLCV